MSSEWLYHGVRCDDLQGVFMTMAYSLCIVGESGSIRNEVESELVRTALTLSGRDEYRESAESDCKCLCVD